MYNNSGKQLCVNVYNMHEQCVILMFSYIKAYLLLVGVGVVWFIDFIIYMYIRDCILMEG